MNIYKKDVSMLKKSIFLITLLTLCCSAAHDIYGMEAFQEWFDVLWQKATGGTITHMQETQRFTEFEHYKYYAHYISPGFQYGEVEIRCTRQGSPQWSMHVIRRDDRIKHIADLERTLQGAQIISIEASMYYKQYDKNNLRK